MSNGAFVHVLPGPVHIARTILILSAATCSSFAEAHSSTQHSQIPRLLQSQAPIDLNGCPVPQAVVFVVDSSSSVARADSNLNTIKAFLVDTYDKLQIPPLMSGLIRFEDQWEIVAPMTFDKSALLTAVRYMSSAIGETLLSPALLAAQDLLLVNNISVSNFKHKTVVVITDGNPNDEIETKNSADMLRKNGIRVIVVMIGEPKTKFEIGDIVSTPVEDNIIRVPSLPQLLDATSTLLELLDLPCSCEPGLNVSINITNSVDKCDNSLNTKHVSLEEPLPHGTTISMQCMDVLSGYQGIVNLTCMDAQLFASHSCKQTCRPDNTNALVIFNKERILLRPPREMYSGGVEEVHCNDVIPGTVGAIQLLCDDGTLLVEHRCVQGRCPAGLSVSVSHESAVANVEAPVGGLDSGSSLLYQCKDHFANSTGSISLTCFDGELRASALCINQTTPDVEVDCSTLTPTPMPDVIINTEQSAQSEGSGVPIWAVVIYCMITACVGALFMFCFLNNLQKHHKRVINAVVPLATRDREMQTEDSGKGVNLSSPLPAPQPPPTPQPQPLPRPEPPSPVMYAELMRGTQRPTDIVFLLDSSISIGEQIFQKATEFLLELTQYFEMPPVRAGLIQFNHNAPFPDFADITGDKAELEGKIKLVKYNAGETEMGPPLAHAAEMLEKLGSLTKKVIIVLTDGNPNDKVHVRTVAEQNKNKGIQMMFVLVGARASDSFVRELATTPAERNVIHWHSYRERQAAASAILAEILESEKWVRRMKCTVPLTPYKVVPDIDAITGTEVMCWNGQHRIVHDGFEPWCSHAQPPHPPQSQAKALSSSKPNLEWPMIELQKNSEDNSRKAMLAQCSDTELHATRLAREKELTELRKAKLAYNQGLAEWRRAMLAQEQELIELRKAKLAPFPPPSSPRGLPPSHDQEMTERQQMTLHDPPQDLAKELANERKAKLATEQRRITQHKAHFYKRSPGG
eukprot:gnl/MRDRNA2_/MRDRNA2_100439_c0_seq1.p1 gnl/MRDRNA2_/MRDRNA2_100439_c0~~gnl/MRDRNA2_/MRDRNA2_100439_c0_seq1.p1  ORF type:complete len:972 (+),score=138.16 gnl/MRDRNA2_/MRDRNA2_100439_c0_seq1:86-3001(+)